MGQPKAAYKEREIVLTSTDRLCFSCPLADCVGEENVRCPIWQERHMLRMLARRKKAAELPVKRIKRQKPERPIIERIDCTRCLTPLVQSRYKQCDRCRARSRQQYRDRVGIARAKAARLGDKNWAAMNDNPPPMRAALWND